MNDCSVEAIAARMAATDLRCSVLEVATTLPRIYRELSETLGPHEARRRFDAALSAALLFDAA